MKKKRWDKTCCWCHKNRAIWACQTSIAGYKTNKKHTKCRIIYWDQLERVQLRTRPSLCDACVKEFGKNNPNQYFYSFSEIRGAVFRCHKANLEKQRSGQAVTGAEHTMPLHMYLMNSKANAKLKEEQKQPLTQKEE